jgi:hypothetical protein
MNVVGALGSTYWVDGIFRARKWFMRYDCFTSCALLKGMVELHLLVPLHDTSTNELYSKYSNSALLLKVGAAGLDRMRINLGDD